MTAIYAALGASAAGLFVLYPAAVRTIHAVVDFHDRHTDRPSPAPIQPHREPIGALTAQPHFEAVDLLGPWNPSQHQPADTPIYAACVNTVNTGALR